jgi:hypothetical protein
MPSARTVTLLLRSTSLDKSRWHFLCTRSDDFREREGDQREREITCTLARGTRASRHGDGRWQGRGYVVAAAVLLVTSASPRSVGISVGRLAARRTSYRVPRSPPLYIALSQGPTNHILVGRPRSGRGRGVGSSRWTRSCEINLTFSPLISTLLLTLTLHFTCFITDQYIEHVSSSQLNCR